MPLLVRQGHGAAHRHHAHALDAGRDHQVLGPGQHALRSEMHGLLRRPALAVDGHAGHGLRQPSRQPRVPGDVDGLRADLGNAAHDDVFDRGRIDARPSDQLAQHVCREVYRVDRRKATVPLADGASDRPDDVCLRHDATSMTPAALPPACTRADSSARRPTFAVTLRLPRSLASAIPLQSCFPPTITARLL